MNRMIAFAFAILFALAAVIPASAQTSDSIWLTANTTSYKTGETVLVALNAAAGTPVQGFTFQIRYDPSCLKPVNASSPIPGMNGLPLPQLTGLVDGSYASTTPQTVTGILAEIKFTALKACETGLTLESAALAIRNAAGFAAPLTGVSIGERNVSLIIDKEVVVEQAPQPETGSVLSLEPPKAEQSNIGWIVVFVFVILMGLLMLGAYKVFRIGYGGKSPSSKRSAGTQKAALHIKHGPQAGQSFALNKLPIVIGRDPRNDICLNDPHLISQHAQIYSKNNGYYIRDLGGGTFINGHPVKGSTVVLHRGDVVRLGKSVLFVFG